MAFPLVPLITGLFGLGKDYMDGRKKVAEQSFRIKEAKVKAVEKDAASTEDWNRIKAEEGKTSWKDEYWTIVLSVPAILAFIPGMEVYVSNGFEVLAKMPEWYRYALGLAIAAAFGFRQLAKIR